MRDIFFSSKQPWPILLLSWLLLSPHFSRAQKTSSEETAGQLPDAPTSLASVSEPPTHFNLTYQISPLSFEQNEGTTESWTRFPPPHTGSDRLAINTDATLTQDRTEFWDKNKYFNGSAPTKGMTFAPAYAQAHHEAIYGPNDLEYYGRHIPWAGSVILRVGQQAKAHPHVTTLIKAIHPRF